MLLKLTQLENDFRKVAEKVSLELTPFYVMVRANRRGGQKTGTTRLEDIH